MNELALYIDTCMIQKYLVKNNILEYIHYDILCRNQKSSHVWLFATPWTVAPEAPLSMGFSRQEYWSG